jgi:prolyl 4-hydroxylase
LSEQEVDELIRVASTEGYRMEDEHPKHVRDVNVTNCDSIRCMKQPFMMELSRRASELLGLHPNNFESMEFVDYSPGQHYVWHKDEYSWEVPIRDPAAVLSGPRLLTMFYYLSDVEKGGETAFAGPDVTGRTKRLVVTPKKGKVILWANMKEDWRFHEPAAMHSALPVLEGRKLAGTLWIHASGFRIPELYAGRECNPRYYHYDTQEQGAA